MPDSERTEVRFMARGRKPRIFGFASVIRARSSYLRPGDIAKRFCSSEVWASLGTITAVPSQLIPEKPVVTLSRTPSSTDVMTTSAKTPSMRSVSVRIERSLCAQSSIRPPVTTSQMRESRAASERETLLIVQRLHRGEAARLQRRIDREEEAEDEGQEERPDEALRVHVERDLEDRRDHLRERDADEEADEPAEAGQEQRLGHELLEDLAARGADRHLDAHLADAFLERRELDVHVDHPAADERQNAGEHENQVVDVALAAPLPDALRDVVDPEILLLAVAGLQDRREALAELLDDVDVGDLEDDAVQPVVRVSLHPLGDEGGRQRDELVPPGEDVPLAVAESEDLLPEDADHRHRDVAHADDLVERLACRKEDAHGLVAEDAHGGGGLEVPGREEPALVQRVPVHGEIVGRDAGDLAILIGEGRPDAGPGEFLDADALHGLQVDPLALRGVVGAQPEVRVLEGRRLCPVLDGLRGLDVELLEAAYSGEELVGVPPLAVRDGEAAQDGRHAEHDPEGLEGRAAEVLPDLDPRAEHALAECARRGHGLGGGRVRPEDQAVAQLDLALGHRGDVGIVRDEHDRVALAVQLLEEAEHLGAGLRVERAGGLVREEEGRPVREGPGDRDALALAPGELRGQHMCLLGDADFFQHLHRAAASLPSGDAGVQKRELHVAQDGGLRQEVVALEDEADLLVADARERAAGQAFDGLAIQGVTAVGGGVEAAQDGHERRLAGARPADERHELALLDGHVDPAQGVDGVPVRAENLRQAACLDDPGHRGQLSSSFSTFFFVGSSRQTWSFALRPVRISARSRVATPAATGITSKKSFQWSESQMNLVRPARPSRASASCLGLRLSLRR